MAERPTPTTRQVSSGGPPPQLLRDPGQPRFAAAYFTLAVAIFYDKNTIFPKYFAYVTIWQIVTEVIASQMWLFGSGAFAWNGVIAFWTGVLIFGTWLTLLIRATRVAGDRESLSSPPVN